MDLPPLAPAAPGRSALPLFRPLEQWVAAQRGAAKAAAEAALAEARAEAERVRASGEARLREVVVEAEREAVRTAEDRARDRVSAARLAVHRWVEDVERGLEPVVAEALAKLTGGSPDLPPPHPSGGGSVAS